LLNGKDMPELRRRGGNSNSNSNSNSTSLCTTIVLWLLTLSMAALPWSRGVAAVVARRTRTPRTLALRMAMTGTASPGASAANTLIICGPSGVGKGTVINALLTQWGPDRLALSVSHTTRAPRPGEIDGVHYHFVTKEQMQTALTLPGSFLEHAEVHGNLYGTSRDAVDSIHRQGKMCVLDVDVNGVKSMKRLHFPGKYVFLTPPSVDTLMQRLKARGSETDAQIALVRLMDTMLSLLLWLYFFPVCHTP